MKKAIKAAFLFFLLTAAAGAAELKVGDKAADFSLSDLQRKVYNLESAEFKGRVLSIFYIVPDKKDLNSHVENALLKDELLDRDKSYQNVGIINLKAAKLPKFIVSDLIKDKQRKTGATILLDPDFTIISLWGLKKNTSNFLVLDKDRVCRYIYKGKMPPQEVTIALNIIKEYQVK